MTGRIRKTTRPGNKAIDALLPQWILAAAVGTVSVTWIRVSARSTGTLIVNTDDISAALAHRPGIQRLAASGGAEMVLAQTPQGEALRRQLGIVRVERRHAHPAADPADALMGYMWPDEESRELLLLIHDSAAQSNVWPEGDLLGTNAVTELLVQLTMHPAVGELHMGEWNRWVRQIAAGARVVDAARHGGCFVFEGTTRSDFYTPEGQASATMKSTMTSGERDGIRKRTTRGQLARLTREEIAWPYALSFVPVGYTVRGIHREVLDIKKVRIATLRADLEHATAWTEFFVAVAQSRTWLECGRILAKHRLPCRGQKLRGRTYDEVTDLQLERAAATLGNARTLAMLRDCRYQNMTPLPYPVAPGALFEGHEVDRTVGQCGVVPVDVKLPPHGITLAGEHWAAWEERLSRRTVRGRTTAAPRRALSGLARWEEPGCQFNLSTVGSDGWAYYQVRRRATADGVDADGQARGWDSNEGELVASLPCGPADRAFGRALEDAAAGAVDRLAVLREVRPEPAGQSNPPRATREDLETSLEAARENAEDSEQAYDRAPTANRQARRDDDARTVSGLEAELAQFDIDDAQQVLAPEGGEHDAVLDVSGLAGLAGVLQASVGGTMPLAVNNALKTTLRGSLRLHVRPEDPRTVTMTATVHWPALDGSILALPVEAIAPNVTRDPSDRSLAESLARAMFHEGRSLTAAIEQVGGAQSRDAAFRHVDHWLRDHGVVSRCLRHALIDNPIKEAKSIVWSVLTGASTHAAADPLYVGLVRRTYLSDGTNRTNSMGAWSRDVRLARTLLNVFADMAGRGEDVGDGLDSVDLARLARSTSSSVMKLAGRHATTDPRYAAILDRTPEDRCVLRPFRCSICSGWLLHVVLVPETRDVSGLVCGACCALADGTPLPPAYLALWDRATVPTDGARTVVADARFYEPAGPPPGHVRLLRIGEAAAHLAVSAFQLRKWADAGLIRAVRVGPSSPRRFSLEDLERFSLTLPDSPTELVSPIDLSPDSLTLRQAAESIHVRESALRALALSTPPDAVPLRYLRVGSRSAVGQFAVLPTDLALIDPGWIDAHDIERLTLADVIVLTGATAWTIRQATQRGELACLRVGGKARYRADDVETWRRRSPHRTPRA